MILYNKSGDFLGIGKDELSFLGYEDLDEFKNTCTDVADLFVNKPGYIFKFKNFSWIDYALHSGAPKKSVIIKLKTGNEIEVTIKIKELFLYSPQENEEFYYSVEFINNTSINSESSFAQPVPVPQDTPQIVEEPFMEQDNAEEIRQKAQSISLEEDFTQEQTNDISVDFDTIEKEKPALKLQMDNTVFEEEKISTNDEIQIFTETDHNLTEDYTTSEMPKLKIDTIPNEETFEPIIDISSDYENKTEIIEEKEPDENIDFDLVQCVENLGLDISLVGELITDYIDKIDATIPIIKTSLENEDEELFKNNIYKLKGISDNLQMIQLSNRLGNLLEATNNESKLKELEKFEKIVAQFKRELI